MNPLFFIKDRNYPKQNYWVHQFYILLRSLCLISLLPVAFYSWPQVFHTDPALPYSYHPALPYSYHPALPYSSLHNSSNCLIFCGFRLWTLTTRVFHKFSIGFKSGHWLGQFRILIPLFSNHSFVSFVWHFHLSVKELAGKIN